MIEEMPCKIESEERSVKVLTISIAAYNIENYISYAIESCLIPNIEELDIIIVDDGSSDRTAEIAKKYEAQYPDSIRVINKENGGYGSTLNTSLDLARGTYFRYLDGDDWFDNNLFDRYVELLKGADEDVVITPYVKRYVADGSSEIVDPVATMAQGSYRFSELIISRSMTCPIAYKTDVLKSAKVKFSEHKYYVDNEYALLPMNKVETALVLHLPIYQYRIGRGGQSISLETIVTHRYDNRDVLFNILGKYASKGVIEDKYETRDYVIFRLSSLAAEVYRDMALTPFSSEVKNDICDYDTDLMKYPEIYKLAARRSKLVRLLRYTGFVAYPIAHALTCFKYRSGVVV